MFVHNITDVHLHYLSRTSFLTSEAFVVPVDKMSAAVFIQNSGTKEILQSQKIRFD